MAEEIAVIGSGLAGLTAAAALAAAGRTVTVFDKGRGLGGRIATRRQDAVSFDHGAAVLQGAAPGFQEWCAAESAAGRLAHWPSGSSDWIGIPEMKAPLRVLADGLDLRQGVRIAKAEHSAGWHLTAEDGAAYGPFQTVLCTVPAPQAAVLFGDRPELAGPLASVEIDPQWAVLLAWDALPGGPAFEMQMPGGPVEKVVRMGTRPGRSAAREAWVVHAAPDWSAAHLEVPGDEVTDLLLKALAHAFGTSLAPPEHAAAHRWRYARTRTPLGAPLLADATGTLLLGGDWTLGAAAGHAWESGQALARAVLTGAFR